MQEISKAAALSAKLVMAGESWLTKMSSIQEGELLDMNLNHLRHASEAAEEVRSHLEVIGICQNLTSLAFAFSSVRDFVVVLVLLGGGG